MPSLKSQLNIRLKGAKRLAIVGIGSPLRGDDAAGLLLIQELKKSLKKAKLRMPVKLFSCGVAPENYTGEIKRFEPSLILIVDAVDMAKDTGTIGIIDTKRKSTNVSFSTHGMPLQMFIEYLTRSIGCRIVSIGVQPQSIGFGLPAAMKVNKAVQRISGLIRENVVNRIETTQRRR